MRISSFHIEDFGIFTNVEVTNLPRGMAIFFGQNEAGKSTCLEFLRYMLTGHNTAAKNRKNRYAPLSGAQPGGSMILDEMGEKGDIDNIVLIRRGQNNSPISLSANGQPVAPELLARTFAGITPQVYKSVFGFSLGELEAFETLDADGVRNALYGASFGTGLNSPSTIISSLVKSREDIFAPRASVRVLNQAFAAYQQTLKEIGELQAKNKDYDKMRHDLEKEKENRAALHQQINDLEVKLHCLERQLNVWQQWEKWQNIGQTLQNMAPLLTDFPEDAQARLARLTAARENCERQVESQLAKLAALREKRDSKVFDEILLAKLAFLQRLAEQKSSYRDACRQIGFLREKYDRLAGELQQNLDKLGPGWTCHKIHALDRSLFSDQELEKLGIELKEAEAARQAAIDELKKCNETVAQADEAVTEIKAELAAMPEIQAILTENERIDLRENMTLLEKCRRDYPDREEAFRKSKTVLANAASQAGIALPEIVDDESSNLVKEKLHKILASHQEARQLALEVRQRNREAEIAADALNRAQQEVENIKQTLEQAEAEWHAHASPGREALERRKQALKNLRSLSGSLETEKERLQDLDNRIAIAKSLKSGANLPLTIVAIILLGIGGAIYLSHTLLGLDELRFGEGLLLPLHDGLAYAALVLGVILLAVGHAGAGKDHKRRKLELDQLLGRRETCSAHLAELDAQATENCRIAQIESLDPIIMDATEMLLEREKEQCLQEENSRLQIDRLQKKYNDACASRDGAQALTLEKEKAVQAGRRHWHTLMDSLNAGFVPSPEDAETFYIRVETCKTAYDNIVIANAEMDAVWEDLHLREESITSMPAVKATLESASEPLSLEEAVKIVLSSCSDAEAVHNQRQQRLGAQENMEKTLARVREEQEKASTVLSQCNNNYQAVLAQWEQNVARLDLGENPHPDTVKNAFKYMDQSLKIEADQIEIKQEIDHAQQEMTSLEEPLAKLREQFSLDHVGNDWLGILDELLDRAQKAAATASERKNIETAIATEETELDSARAALGQASASEQALLRQAGVETIDDFLRLERRQTERRNLESEYANLKIVLELAAQKQPLEQFLAGFAAESQDSLELKQQKLNQEIVALKELAKQTGDKIGELKTCCKQLETATELAQLSQDAAMQQEKLDELAHEWSMYALAVAILEEAKKTFEKERQPEVIRRASEIFSRITNGKWKGISASLEKNTQLSIINPHGKPVSPENLSRGAQEQAYLSLRIAYIENHAAHAPSLPVIMDEILVNFDPQRVERSARALAHMAASPKGQQILYFTCQPHMVDALTSAVPHAPVYVMENSQIRRQG